MVNSLQNRTYLHDRHRLSHQQIGKWLGENSGTEFLQEKIRQLEFVKSFLWATDLIRNRNIPFVSLKGPLLSCRIYQDPTVRISHDIDLLIDVEFIEPVVKILTENGYAIADGLVWPERKIQQELLLNICHHLSFFNKERNSCLEVHWLLMQGVPVSQKEQKETIGRNLKGMDFAGRKFTVLSYEFELLYLLIHGSRHGWSRLKWLVDIHEYPKNEVDISTFGKLVARFKAGRIIDQTNFLLNRFFKSQLPYSGNSSLPDHFIRYAIQSVNSDIKPELSNRELLHYYRYLWLMFPGFYYKFHTVKRAFYNPRDILAIDSSYKIFYFMYRPYGFFRRRILNVQ